MKKTESFGYAQFDDGTLFFNKKLYTKEQALAQAKALIELFECSEKILDVKEGFIAYQFHKDWDDELSNGWVYSDDFKAGRGMLAVWFIEC